jgi:hypothetical protein
MCLEITEYQPADAARVRRWQRPRSTVISQKALSALYAIPAAMLAAPSASNNTVTLLA